MVQIKAHDLETGHTEVTHEWHHVDHSTELVCARLVMLMLVMQDHATSTVYYISEGE